MSYKVTSALVVAKDQMGKLHHRYHGDVIPWLNAEQEAHFLRHGLVERVGGAPAAPASANVEDDGPEPPGGKPRKTAPQDKWIEYGVGQGHDRAELEALSRQELIDLLG